MPKDDRLQGSSLQNPSPNCPCGSFSIAVFDGRHVGDAAGEFRFSALGEIAVIVAASSDSFPNQSLLDIFERVSDLEISVGGNRDSRRAQQLTPAQVLADTEKAVALCRDTHRLGIAAYAVEIAAQGEAHYEQFAACCRLAKATKVACLSVPSGELGTPFNEEVEHLRRLVSIATLESAVVSIRTQIGRLSEDPDTVVVLCDNVKGLGVTLDPSHYTCQPNSGRNYEKLLKYTYHVQLRDTSKTELQVRVGQGEIDYGQAAESAAAGTLRSRPGGEYAAVAGRGSRGRDAQAATAAGKPALVQQNSRLRAPELSAPATRAVRTPPSGATAWVADRSALADRARSIRRMHR